PGPRRERRSSLWPHAAVLRPVAFGFATVAAMKIRYNPVLGVTMIVLGVVCEVLGLWLLALGETDPTLFVGVIVVLLGLPYLLRPYFLVHHTTVESAHPSRAGAPALRVRTSRAGGQQALRDLRRPPRPCPGGQGHGSFVGLGQAGAARGRSVPPVGVNKRTRSSRPSSVSRPRPAVGACCGAERSARWPCRGGCPAETEVRRCVSEARPRWRVHSLPCCSPRDWWPQRRPRPRHRRRTTTQAPKA